jgi:hypothetical protein
MISYNMKFPILIKDRIYNDQKLAHACSGVKLLKRKCQAWKPGILKRLFFLSYY